MRILIVSHTRLKCGVAEFGRLQAEALQKNGIDVVEWQADYPTYLPPDAEEYDIVHLNWHGGTINHILPQHLPKIPQISCFFHESTQIWERDGYPKLWDGVQHRFTAEPMEGGTYFPHPGPDVDVSDLWPFPEDIFIGTSGLRKDGLDWIVPVFKEKGWHHDGSRDRWLSTSAEVRRLARCTINVAHYHSAYAGQSGGVMVMVAARRPILINSSRMLRILKMYSNHLFMPTEIIPPQVYCNDDVAAGVETILRDIEKGEEIRPDWLADNYCWSVRCKKMIEQWEGGG